jgi:hypothetical protein
MFFALTKFPSANEADANKAYPVVGGKPVGDSTISQQSTYAHRHFYIDYQRPCMARTLLVLGSHQHSSRQSDQRVFI